MVIPIHCIIRQKTHNLVNWEILPSDARRHQKLEK
jgi:hypothetical protein